MTTLVSMTGNVAKLSDGREVIFPDGVTSELRPASDLQAESYVIAFRGEGWIGEYGPNRGMRLMIGAPEKQVDHAAMYFQQWLAKREALAKKSISEQVEEYRAANPIKFREFL